MKSSLLENLPKNLLEPYLEKSSFPASGSSVSCAVSGGADSTAMALLARAGGCELTIIHIDHQLRADSKKDAKAVQNLAKKLGAEFRSLTAEIPEGPGPNLEARARDARYKALDSIDPNALLGHTADDQAETLLLNLIWGSGPEGLAGMKKDVRRPILNLRRTDTEKICELHSITPLQDPTNKDPAFRRNRIRSELIPLLNEISGKDIVPILCRTADIQRGVSDLLNQITQDIDPTDARAVSGLNPDLSSWVIKRWLTEENSDKKPPDAAAIERVLAVAKGEILATEIPGGYRVSRSSMRLNFE